MSIQELPEQIGRRILEPRNGNGVDYIELWTGSVGRIRTGGWGGDFVGRPDLAEALWSALKPWGRSNSRSTLMATLGSLRAFWRFLAAYEKQFDERLKVEDLGVVIAGLWLHPPENATWSKALPTQLSQVGHILKIAHSERSTGTRFAWLSAGSELGQGKDVANFDQAKAALNVLKSAAREVFSRWSRADQLAASGRNLLTVSRTTLGHLGFTPKEADFHTTYRA